jgi:hypothetical protein
MVMKRTALLLAILAVFSVTSVSQVYASPIAGEKAVTLSSWLSYYFAYFLRAHRHNFGYEYDRGLVDDDGNGDLLRGDADDYANGREDEEDGPIDPGGRGDKRNTGLTAPGGLTTGLGGRVTKK